MVKLPVSKLGGVHVKNGHEHRSAPLDSPDDFGLRLPALPLSRSGSLFSMPMSWRFLSGDALSFSFKTVFGLDTKLPHVLSDESSIDRAVG